jgi:hypothetical protein
LAPTVEQQDILDALPRQEFVTTADVPDAFLVLNISRRSTP